MTNYIWVTTSFEGIHKYPDAPDDVAFLRNEHRHMFHIKVFIEVFHNERDIEFIQFKRFINCFFLSSELNNKSCEMISDDLAIEIKTMYPNRKIKIEVSEDKENGSEKEYDTIE